MTDVLIHTAADLESAPMYSVVRAAEGLDVPEMHWEIFDVDGPNEVRVRPPMRFGEGALYPHPHWQTPQLDDEYDDRAQGLDDLDACLAYLAENHDHRLMKLPDEPSSPHWRLYVARRWRETVTWIRLQVAAPESVDVTSFVESLLDNGAVQDALTEYVGDEEGEPIEIISALHGTDPNVMEAVAREQPDGITGGIFDRGRRILLVDVTTTRVEAECTLGEYYDNNETDEEEAMHIEDALSNSGAITLGGGAAPLVRLELVS